MTTDLLRVIYIDDRPDKEPVVVEQRPGQDRLDFLQALVQGLIECVSLNDTTDLWVNEEGLYRNDFTVNKTATLVARMRTGHRYTLVGPAFMTGTDGRGNTTSVTDELIAEMRAIPGVWTSDDILASRSTETEMA